MNPDEVVEETWNCVLKQMDWDDETYKKAGGRERLEESLYDYLEKQFNKVLSGVLVPRENKHYLKQDAESLMAIGSIPTTPIESTPKRTVSVERIKKLSIEIAKFSASKDERDGSWYGHDTSVGDLPKYIFEAILAEINEGEGK